VPDLVCTKIINVIVKNTKVKLNEDTKDKTVILKCNDTKREGVFYMMNVKRITVKKNNRNGKELTIMDRTSLPEELVAVGVEFIELDKTVANKGIPSEDIKRIVAAIKQLEVY